VVIPYLLSLLLLDFCRHQVPSSRFNTDYKSSEPLKTLVMLCL